MSDEMSSWTYIASASSRLRGYLSQKDIKRNIPAVISRQFAQSEEDRQTWREWAGQKFTARRSGNGQESIERVALFPGWAARRYTTNNKDGTYAT
jgi:hypothetical protein